MDYSGDLNHTNDGSIIERRWARNMDAVCGQLQAVTAQLAVMASGKKRQLLELKQVTQEGLVMGQTVPEAQRGIGNLGITVKMMKGCDKVRAIGPGVPLYLPCQVLRHQAATRTRA